MPATATPRQMEALDTPRSNLWPFPLIGWILMIFLVSMPMSRVARWALIIPWLFIAGGDARKLAAAHPTAFNPVLHNVDVLLGPGTTWWSRWFAVGVPATAFWANSVLHLGIRHPNVWISGATLAVLTGLMAIPNGTTIEFPRLVQGIARVPTEAQRGPRAEERVGVDP